MPPTLPDDGQSQITSGLRNFGQITLLHVKSTKAHAPCFDQTIVDPLCYDPTVNVFSPS
jgi:hypothetical protein